MSQKRKQILLICAVLASILLATLWSGLTGAGQVDPHGRPSSFYSDPSGSKASYLVLDHFLSNLARIRKPFRFWVLEEEKREAATVVVQKPHLGISIKDAQALANWIQQGGRLIYVSNLPWTIEAPIETGFSKPSEPSDDSTEDWKQNPADENQRESMTPKSETRHDSVELEVGQDLIARLGVTIFDGSSEGVQTFGPLRLEADRLEGELVEAMISHGDRTIVGKLPYGDGEIIVVPDGLAFSNRRLADSDNVFWLLQQCLKSGGAVFFDEFHQGFGRRKSMFALIFRFLKNPWGFAFLQLGLVGFLLFWGPWRRFGSVLDAPLYHRYNPMERIAARAALFKEAKAFDLAFQVTHQHLARLLKSRHPTKFFFLLPMVTGQRNLKLTLIQV